MPWKGSASRCLLAAIAVAGSGVAPPAEATIPPPRGVRFPEAYRERVRRDPGAFTYRRALLPLVQRIRQARLKLFAAGPATPTADVAVAARQSIPVLTLKFSDTGSAPIDVTALQRELFDGPWPTGTMTEYYREISYGRFELTGQVQPFKTLKNRGSFYTGGCNGLCAQAKLPDMLKETLTLNAGLDWGRFDNEGPDGKPNSGDDDGFVDFAAFVQPNVGGECGKNTFIWSHRFSLSGWGVTPFATKSPKSGGGTIMIDDYVVMPAKACDGKTMIQIGVFAHEFGHAFGLPDLYDTDDANGVSEGAGNWCLMAAGSWGGDGNSPQRPTHMSAWSKTYLGWVLPSLQTGGLASASIKDAESNAFAIKVPISTTQYYLIENRQKTRFDEKLPIGGLLVWKINDAVVNAGLANNRVNANETNQGVELVEADGRNDLDAAANRGDAGDPFPGSRNVKAFDNITKPASIGRLALCDISPPAATMTARISMGGRCQSIVKPPPQAALAPPDPAASGRQRAAPPAGSRDTAPAESQPLDVTVAALQNDPAAYAGKLLKVDGTLDNAGKNYFTDRRLVLRQAEGGGSVPVQWPGLPLEVPRPPGASTSRPATLSDYLGQKVEVVGVLERVTGRDGVARYTLTIQKATK
jgi:M6 family metalloprotease-like protein